MSLFPILILILRVFTAVACSDPDPVAPIVSPSATQLDASSGAVDSIIGGQNAAAVAPVDAATAVADPLLAQNTAAAAGSPVEDSKAPVVNIVNTLAAQPQVPRSDVTKVQLKDDIRPEFRYAGGNRGGGNFPNQGGGHGQGHQHGGNTQNEEGHGNGWTPPTNGASKPQGGGGWGGGNQGQGAGPGGQGQGTGGGGNGGWGSGGQGQGAGGGGTGGWGAGGQGQGAGPGGQGQSTGGGGNGGWGSGGQGAGGGGNGGWGSSGQGQGTGNVGNGGGSGAGGQGQGGGNGGGWHGGHGEGSQCNSDDLVCAKHTFRDCQEREWLWTKCPNLCDTCNCRDTEAKCRLYLDRCAEAKVGFVCRRSCGLCLSQWGRAP